MPGYNGSLLRLAVDLTDRFMPAFDTPTGIPLSWVNLRRVGGGGDFGFGGPCAGRGSLDAVFEQPASACKPAASELAPVAACPKLQGQIPGDVRSTCTACAGTLLLEFGVLSRLTGACVEC